MPKYRKAHPEKARKWEQQRSRNLRLKVFEYLGGAECVRCKCKVLEVLEINHKNLGGRKEYAAFSWRQIYRSIIKNKRKDEFEVLCKVCNAAHYVEKKFNLEYDIISHAL